MSTTIKTAAQLVQGDKIVRTFHHDGTPKRTATIAKVETEKRDGYPARYMVTTADGDNLGWYSTTYQFIVEVHAKG